MIAFATLWLGLVSGTVPVELLAGPEVARVELLLDGTPCASLDAPPWTASCELGSELAPHELAALAFDRAGRQTAETRQWLNLPREPAELEVGLATEPGPPARLVARLAWAGPGGAAPIGVRATLDGEPLPISADAQTVELPALGRGGARLLRVEVEFPGGVTASRELAVGGDLAEQIAEELTGVPVEVTGRGEGARLRSDDRELPVVALEKGEADLVAVLDPGSLEMLAKLAHEATKQRVSRSGSGPGLGGRTITAEPRATVPLPEGARLRLVWPVAESRRQGELRFDLFPTSPARTAADGTLLDQLRLAATLPPPTAARRLADAVALAALTAAQPGRRRAVLLVLGERPTDASSYAADEVRRFLDRLRVPLVVWSMASPAPEVTAAWGAAETVTSLPRLERAARNLDLLLARQRIAWVAGRHLPQRLLAVDGGGLRLATADAPPEEAGHDPFADGLAEVDPGPEDALVGDGGAPGSSLPAGLERRPLQTFALATDVRDERLLATLTRVASALPEDFATRFGLRPAPAGTLLLFARTAGFRQWLANQGGGDAAVEGFARGGVAALAVEGYRSEEVSALLVHELSHLLTRAACGRQLPPWLEEGLAEDLAMSRRDSSGRTLAGTLRSRSGTRRLGPLPLPGGATYEVSLGGPAAALVSLVRGPRPPLAELLAMPWRTFAAATGRPERYAASGFFVRFLLDAEQGRWRTGFQAFLAAVAGGGAADPAALEAALGTPVAGLQTPFDAWLRRSAQTTR